MTLQDLRKEIDNKEIDVPKDRNYGFVINESVNSEKQDESEISIKDIDKYIDSWSIPIKIIHF